MLLGGITISTVSIYTHNPMTVPFAVIMDGKTPSYIGSGNSMTDKNHTAHYSQNNQSLYIESEFSDRNTIQDLIKDYLSEERYRKLKVDGLTAQGYNVHSNKAVVTSEKEENE